MQLEKKILRLQPFCINHVVNNEVQQEENIKNEDLKCLSLQ